MAITAIREWLSGANFNWNEGRILVQLTSEGYPGWEEPKWALFIACTHSILDKQFDAGFGGPECPRFIAEDSKAFYFPSQYDGATSLVVVHKDLEHYLDLGNPTPYPGG